MSAEHEPAPIRAKGGGGGLTLTPEESAASAARAQAALIHHLAEERDEAVRLRDGWLAIAARYEAHLIRLAPRECEMSSEETERWHERLAETIDGIDAIRGLVTALRAEHDHFGNCVICDRTCDEGDDLWFKAQDALKAAPQLSDESKNGLQGL